jgi:hypothetical protein
VSSASDHRDIVAAPFQDLLPRLEHAAIVGIAMDEHNGIALHPRKYTAAESDRRARVETLYLWRCSRMNSAGTVMP